MFNLIKQLFIAFLSFIRSLPTKCVSLNNEPCMIRPFLIDLNPVELKYYPFMSSLAKFSGSCNSADNFKIEANAMLKGRICNSNRKCNNQTYQCESKKLSYLQKRL